MRLAQKYTCSQFWSPKLLVKKLKLHLRKLADFLFCACEHLLKRKNKEKRSKKKTLKIDPFTLFYLIRFKSWSVRKERLLTPLALWHINRSFQFNSIQLIRVREKVSARGSQRLRPTPNNYIRAAWKKRIKRWRANWNNLKVDEKRKEKENHLCALI